MYGKSDVTMPRRVVCLAAEHVEICHALGAGERVVGVPDAPGRPHEAPDEPGLGELPRVRIDRILGLEPDLILAFSDRQSEVSAELIRAGMTVLCTNQRSMDEILQVISIVGAVLGLADAALDLVQDIRDEIRQVREYSSMWPRRPKVYFEEWPDPPVAGIRWVSEIVEIAGGRDVFPELRERRTARERAVSADEVARRNPDIIVASWRGTPVDLAAIAARPGWERVSAVVSGRVHEVDGADILVAGPSVLGGLRRIHELVQSSLEG
jgi:iron complex transport system substrate-binding protein